MIVAMFSAWSLWVLRRTGSIRLSAVALFTCFLAGFVVYRAGFHFPRTELAFLLAAQPVAHTLGGMMSGDPSRPFKWVTVVCSVVTVGFLVAAAVRENMSADGAATRRSSAASR